MLYLKNSLVNLTIIFFSLFFLTISRADDNNFIFPQKKIITINNNENKLIKTEISKNFKSSDLPQKNPFKVKVVLQEKSKPVELNENKKLEKKLY